MITIVLIVLAVCVLIALGMTTWVMRSPYGDQDDGVFREGERPPRR